MVMRAQASFGSDLIAEMDRQSRFYDDDITPTDERRAMLQLGRELLRERGQNADTMSDEQVITALKSEIDLDPFDIAHDHFFGDHDDDDFDEDHESRQGTSRLLVVE